MTLDPRELHRDLDLLEDVEKATLRLVVQAIYDFRDQANQIFIEEQDLVKDIGEDISREALDRLGTSTIPVRLFGNIDYKQARYVFHPEFSIRQALFVDSKAEKVSGEATATIQMSQTSMRVRQMRQGRAVEERGTLPPVLNRDGNIFLVTTIFVKYNYREKTDSKNDLESVSIICLPNGWLQERYNPTPDDSFWRAGRNAPSRGEPFRVRIGLEALEEKARWRVQRIRLAPPSSYSWCD